MMPRWSIALTILMGAAAPAVAQPGPVPTPSPAPVAPEVSPPPLAPIPISGFLVADPPYQGPFLGPGPALGLAILEVGRALPADDPAVASVSAVLTQLTAVYVEDAPRIAELTSRVVQRIRAANRAASPLEMLVGATRWGRADVASGNVPRKFEEFARLYQDGRIQGGRDHAATINLMQMSRPSSRPTP